MKLHKPSYGVFMVDVFASSVGIFILISLLYIIESAKATSNEAMVERFETLVKRDLVPVDRYSMPAGNDPLHDWGIRARHAREKQEALILLLRDKVLLYHTNQMLDSKEIVDSDIIRQYYDKYNKNRRLFIEIHYHDAYHLLKAKINEALPPNTHQWIHWAYNAGNLNNPNPIRAGADRPNIDLSKGDPNAPVSDNENGTPSSVGRPNGSEGTGTGGQTAGQGKDDLGSESGEANGSAASGDQANEGGEGEGTGEGEGGQGNASGGQGKNQGAGEGSSEGNGEGQDIPQAMKQEVAKMLNQARNAEQFAQQFLPPETPYTPESDTPSARKSGDKNGQQHDPSESSHNSSNSGKYAANPANDKDSESNSNQKRGQANQADEEATQQQPPTPQQAENYIRKNVFLAVPLYSPIYRFDLDIQVPGFSQQRFNLNSVGLKLHQSPDENSTDQLLKLDHGDTIMPLNNQLNPGQQHKPAGWMQVKVTSVSGKKRTGWLYGHVADEVFMLPLYQNTVQSFSTDDYWFERNSDSLQSFDVTPVNKGKP
jgi:hypothetical protein